MFTYKKHILEFNKPATTSRGSLQTHTVYYIVKTDTVTQKIGIGEAAPLKGLSIDAVDNFEDYLNVWAVDTAKNDKILKEFFNI